MNRNERHVLLLLALLLTLGLLLWRGCSQPKPPFEPPSEIVPSSATAVSPTPPPLPPSPPVSTKPPTGPTTAMGTPAPPKIELHKELIPKNIEIVRCYYAQEIVPPGTTFGFDVNGSGFTSEFEKMIKVESGHDHVRIKNFYLVTANQIHGEMEVGPEAKTGFVYPRVLIKGLPVFSAPDPFAVVRKGEVLTIHFISMEESGRGGRFRIITHLDEALAKTFRIDPSTAGIDVSELVPQLPYLMEGRLQIGPGVQAGEHGLTISINGKEVYRRMGMIRIVRPNIGKTGFIQGLIAQEKFRRPGDVTQIYAQGTGLSPEDIATLDAKVPEFNVGQTSFTYISPLQLRLSFVCPPMMPPGSYSVQVLSKNGERLYEKKDLFKVVPSNWVAGVQVNPPVSAGGQSTLRIFGRDFSDDFVASFKIETDEPQIAIRSLRRADVSTLVADIAVGPSVSPGDYWLHLSAQGKKIIPPFGSIIRVEAAP